MDSHGKKKRIRMRSREKGDAMQQNLISSALSLNMLGSVPASIEVQEVTLEEARQLIDGRKSVVGHPDTASLFSEQLGVPVPACRETIALKKGDTVLVGQYRGPRLPEGATELPKGATIQWLLVEIR